MTDDERRRLAERMRGGYDVVSDDRGRFWLNGTLFGMDISARSEERIRDGLARLADLIDPCDTSHSCRDTVACDREAESGQNLDRNLDTVPIESPAVQKAPETCEYWLDGECYARRTVRPVDREALLELADEIAESYVTGGSDGDELVMSRGAALFVARRIREACGVVE